jgi:leucyl/phenylalanyl-tRNA--protein transferase
MIVNMVIYYLSSGTFFPDPFRDDVDDLLAIGGDLRPERLITAYQKGIFPWYSEDSPILWWSPNPRLILFPKSLHVPRRLKRELKKRQLSVTINMDFSSVITACAHVPRHGAIGTWLVPEMIDAYIHLHELGYAHSIEAWSQGKLVGGLYGLALGRAFFGESMFYRKSNASKIAFVIFVHALMEQDFHLIDCQQTTQHLLRFGAQEVSRKEFLLRLERALEAGQVQPGFWRARSLPDVI